ncbi:hypothetical protein [Faecalibacillus faecis]|uniref:hypothetical protein n=1 Tax=Faecalibacillus faecis TaxID=1982628 RepID=UPI00386ADC58
MKKLKILVLILFFGISLTACETKKNKDITSYMDSISLKKFEKYKTSKKTFVVYVARPSCSDCSLLDDALINDIENNENHLLNKILYLDVTKLHSQKNKWDNFKMVHNINGTPAFIYVENGLEKSVYSWTEEQGFIYKDFLNWLEEKNGKEK